MPLPSVNTSIVHRGASSRTAPRRSRSSFDRSSPQAQAIHTACTGVTCTKTISQSSPFNTAKAHPVHPRPMFADQQRILPKYTGHKYLPGFRLRRLFYGVRRILLRIRSKQRYECLLYFIAIPPLPAQIDELRILCEIRDPFRRLAAQAIQEFDERSPCLVRKYHRRLPSLCPCSGTGCRPNELLSNDFRPEPLLPQNLSGSRTFHS